MMKKMTNLFYLYALMNIKEVIFHLYSKNIDIPMVVVDNIDNDSDDVLILMTCEYGNVASYYLDEKIDLDIQDISNESSFHLYEYDDVLLNGHL
jgi:hypothetical protein